ncbi:hypothetical protein F2P81_015410 [Scophthalmus maximus]|uniref:TNFR-Cys domain-containing protein n=1 Tax=Scophthalmus maximus TaxID=52904 RepID=A0A6A4SMI5_SCOMX|nr:hypothetical protein F2P81_015410 [Scophthalmus maximus]
MSPKKIDTGEHLYLNSETESARGRCRRDFRGRRPELMIGVQKVAFASASKTERAVLQPCDSGQYTSSGECCAECPPGEGVVKKCGATQTVCAQCLDKTLAPAVGDAATGSRFSTSIGCDSAARRKGSRAVHRKSVKQTTISACGGRGVKLPLRRCRSKGNKDKIVHNTVQNPITHQETCEQSDECDRLEQEIGRVETRVTSPPMDVWTLSLPWHHEDFVWRVIFIFLFLL